MIGQGFEPYRRLHGACMCSMGGGVCRACCLCYLPAGHLNALPTALWYTCADCIPEFRSHSMDLVQLNTAAGLESDRHAQPWQH